MYTPLVGGCLRRWLARTAGWILLALLLFVLPLDGTWASHPTWAVAKSSADGERLYFEATGHNVEGAFLQYWQGHGGLPIFGYPLTSAFYERGYLTQYFERTRFELHPEWAGSPYEVSLGHLGRERLKAERRAVPRPSNEGAAAGEQYFSQTGYTVGAPFLQYWVANGGLVQFGLPLTPPLQDGSLKVQYFERARLELHPEYAGTAHHVLLTLLGRERVAGLDPALRDRWLPNPPSFQIQVVEAGREVPMLGSITVKSSESGELRVLDGDNRLYATHSIQAGAPLSLLAAGAPGLQSLMLYKDGAVVAALWGGFRVSTPTWGIQTGDPALDGLYGRVEGFLSSNMVDYTAPRDGATVHGYRSPDNAALWLRDHVHQLKGAKYFEMDMKSALAYFATTQRTDGSFDDYLLHTPVTLVYTDQIEIEADREYLFVEGAWTAWQATGDDAWLRQLLPVMERGLQHTFTDPRRWSPEHGLVKRGFTIDTWDYEQGSTDKHTRRDLDEHTRWSIMHGDNTGAYQSARLLARIGRHFGRAEEAAAWDRRAAGLVADLNRTSWNGEFYTHQVHLTPVDPVGVDERTQLSLSNAYALNRGTLSHEQAVAVLRAYEKRRAAYGSRMVAEWYSIDPPFPATFGTPGEYANGGVMPLVGGELARGAFRQGFEAYGVDILRRYSDLVGRTGGSYLWYHPDGRPGVSNAHTVPTDGWGASAMLHALTEGLAGVVDSAKLYEQVELSPRWAVTDRKAARVALRYGASGAYFAYNWSLRPDGSLGLAWYGNHTQAVRLHLLLPPGMVPQGALLDGAPVPFTLEKVERSLYLNALLPGIGRLEVK